MSSVGVGRKGREKRRHAAKGKMYGRVLSALISHTARMQLKGALVWGLTVPR